MFGSVIGMRSENIRKTRLVFAEYARDTILLVDNDFNDPNASERAKKNYVRGLVEHKLPGTTFDEYQTLILEQSNEVLKSFMQLQIEALSFMADNTELETIEFCREKVANLCSLIRRLNTLFAETGFTTIIDEEAMIAELQRIYICISSKDETALAGSIWLFNQIFDTNFGLAYWQESLETMDDFESLKSNIPNSAMLKTMALLRQFYVHVYQEGNENVDCILLGEYAEVMIEAYSALSACSAIAFTAKDTKREYYDGYTSSLYDAFLDLMTTPVLMLANAAWDLDVEKKDFDKAIQEAIDSDRDIYDEIVAKAELCRNQRFEDYDAMASLANSPDQKKLPPADSLSEEREEAESNDISESIPKVNLIESVRLFSMESQSKRRLKAKRKDLSSVSCKLDKAKRTLENNIDILKNYYVLLREKISFIQEANSRIDVLEKRSMVLTGVTVAASASHYAHEQKKKEDSDSSNSNSNSFDPTSFATGVGAAVSGIALAATEKDLQNLKVDTEDARRKINRLNYVVGHPEENDGLVEEIKALSQKKIDLEQEIKNLNKECARLSTQTLNGKILVSIVCAIIAIALIAAIAYFSPQSSSHSSSRSTSSNAQTSGSTSGGSTSKSTATNQNANSKSNTGTNTSSTSSNTSSSSLASYILPEGNSRYYSSSELESMTDKELYLARNEIFARHGREFKNQDLRDYFGSMSWYVPKYSSDEFDSMDLLNDYEKKNADTMLSIEQKRGSSYLN